MNAREPINPHDGAELDDVLLQRLEGLRKNLLDLSNRNRLLSFKHSERARTHVRIIDELPDTLYQRLTDGQRLLFKSLPEPASEPAEERSDVFLTELEAARATNKDYAEAIASLGEDELNSKRAAEIERQLRDDVRKTLGLPEWADESLMSREEFALRNELQPSYDLPWQTEEKEQAERHMDSDVQTLLLPLEMDRKLSGITDQARTMLQEAGVNTLYVAFGFLEYFEVGGGEQKHLAPLLLLPVQIERRMSKPWRRYSLSSDGADVEVNDTLAIRLLNDYGYELPPFAEDETPESYLRKVSKHVTAQPRWRVRRFVTVGHFGFSKLPMYNDLSTVMWRENRKLERHRLVRQLLLGGEDAETSAFTAPEYDIDSKQVDDRNIVLIADADASQHSAVVDVVDGKDLVIQGPPGTGKSQTITNIVAALMASGKSVLFVAEKLAALNVVYARLQHSQLADYCLQVHSNKVPKTAVLDALRTRIEAQNTLDLPGDFATQIADLKSCRDRLNTYAGQINQSVSALGLSVQQALWGERRLRIDAGEGVEAVGDLMFQDAAELTQLAVSHARDAIKEVFLRLNAISSEYGSLDAHPWSWVLACRPGPFAEEEFRKSTATWLTALNALADARDALTTEFGCDRVSELSELRTIAENLSALPEARPQPLPAIVKTISDEKLHDKVEALLESVSRLPHASGRDADIHVFDPPGRVPTDRSWKRLAEGVSVALRILSKEAPYAHNLADAEQYARELREVAMLVERAVRVAHSTQKAAELQKSNSHVALMQALLALKLVAKLPKDSLVVRNEALLRADAELALKEGYETARKLRESHELLAKVFVLRPLPDIYDVNMNARALRKAGSFSWFDSDVKQAKEFFKSIANTSKRASPSDMSTLLGKLESYLDERRAFEGDARLRELCGNWFKGENTEFERFLDLTVWQREVTEAFPASYESGAAYRRLLLEGSFDDLSGLKAAAGTLSLDVAMEEVVSLAEEVDSIEDEMAAAFVKVDGIDRACAELADAGVASSIPFDNLVRFAVALQDLDDIRIAARSSDEGSQISGLEIANLRAAVGYLDAISNLDVPLSLKTRMAERCKESEFSRMRNHGLEIGRRVADAVRGQAVLYQNSDIDPEVIPTYDSWDANIDALIHRVEVALERSGDLGEWIDYLAARHRAGAGGLSEFMARLEKAEVSSDCAAMTYDWLIHRSLAKIAYDVIPGLSGTSGLSLTQTRKKFQALDRDILALQQSRLAADLCRRSIAQGNGVGKKSSYTELSLIRHEISKKRRHIPLRDLFSRASRALQQMKPCIMMSPLSVSTFLQPGQVEFDVVVIDEASQMPLEDALGAIARGRQCVIVGDNMQLPPTSFFKRFEDAIDEDDEVEDEDLDVESVLDQGMNVFRPPRALRWHYRSQHQNLIAFSNKHFYENKLTIFPSFREEDKRYGVRLQKVDGHYADRRNLAEVEEITEWACECMKLEPGRSMGIVAVNQLQRDLIRDEMDRIFQRDADAEAYRQKWEKTLYPFFVKNLENVQGDERDIIAVSTVYGPNADGKVAQNFGPISRKHGHRRLNVLFTRARQQLVLFTSLTPDDINIGENTGPGPRALKAYLEFTHGAGLDRDWLGEREPKSDFEITIAHRLAKYRYEVVPQVGVSGYFVDLGVRHADFPGQFIVGVECDGATYHSAKSARDRDRLREEVLKGQGWILYRIWSTDWFRDPNGEMRKLLEFIELQADQRREKLKATSDEANEAGEDVEVVPIKKPGEEPAELEKPSADEAESEEDEELFAEDGVSDAGAGEETGEAGADEADAQSDALEDEEPGEDEQPVCAVGDIVVFHYEDDPDTLISAMIVIGESDVDQATISRLSPIGDALVGAVPGEDVDVFLAEGTRTIIVDDVQKRQAALSG